MSAAVTRRAFLGRTSALALGALYPGILRVAAALPLSEQGPRKRVLVLAGLASSAALS